MDGLETHTTWKKLKPDQRYDILSKHGVRQTPAIAVGTLFGRLGCFLNGCCYGDTCNLPWAVSFPQHSPPWDYQRYVQASQGEFSCAKPSCVRLQNAWVSDRTLCYLASGKPAVVQHTGASRFLPDAEGLFRFRTLEEAAHALSAAQSDYERHGRLARHGVGPCEAAVLPERESSGRRPGSGVQPHLSSPAESKVGSLSLRLLRAHLVGVLARRAVAAATA